MPPPFARKVVDLDEVTSTSDLARELVVAGDVELPLLVRARRQKRGRGRAGHSWWSDAGSLTFTLAIDPEAHGLDAGHVSRLALAAAVAIVDAVGPKIPTGIRWPNDVEALGRKLGGILPESVETPGGVRYLVGIGLNVRTRLEDAPAEVRAMAASLSDWGEPPALDEVLDGFLSAFATVVPRLARDEPGLASRWAELDILLGRHVRVDLGPRVVSGVGRGIDPEGGFLLATPDETLRLFGGRVLRS